MVEICLVCNKKHYAKNKDAFKYIEEEYANSSGKLLRSVLQHVLKCTQISIDIKPRAGLCLKCYTFLLDYDDHVVKLMDLQKQFKSMYEGAKKPIQAPPPERIIDLRETVDIDESNLETESIQEEYIDMEEIDEEDFKDEDYEPLEQDCSEDNESALGSIIEVTNNIPEDMTEGTIHVVTDIPVVENKCAYCKLTFPNRGRLRKHVQQAHTKKEHFCKICGASCKDEEYLELHMNIHEGKTEYDCRYCDKRFNKRSNVVRHMAKHWDKKKYQCEKCGLQFSETPRLYNHKLLHQAEENPLICHICNMKCKTIRTFKRHMNLHSEDRKRYPCHICGKTFSEKFTLKPHLRTHPEYVEQQQQAATAVGAATTKSVSNNSQQQVLATIASSKTQVETTTEDESNVCVICCNAFNTKAEQIKHMENEHDVISWCS